MVSTYHFAHGAKRKACDNFLDSNFGTIRFLEKNPEICKICNMGSRENQKPANLLFCDSDLRSNHAKFINYLIIRQQPDEFYI